MDLKFNIFGKSIYSLKEMELIQLAVQWFYDAGRLSSISWAQVVIFLFKWHKFFILFDINYNI